MQETGPTAFRPYLRRLECLTACRCHSRGSAFFSVILRPWVWVRPGSWSPTSRTVVRRSSTWANQAAVIISIISKLRKFRYTRWLSCMKICIIIAATISTLGGLSCTKTSTYFLDTSVLPSKETNWSIHQDARLTIEWKNSNSAQVTNITDRCKTILKVREILK